MIAAVKCSTCNDTGSLPGSHDLDCASCGVAVERVVFEAELPRIARTQAMRDAMWSAYVMGKAAGAAQAVPEGWRVVPIKPTPAMADAGAEVDPERESVWAAYLAAAPKAT